MIQTLNRGESLPPMALSHCSDGAFQLLNGHHRLVAFWLSGRRTLESTHYRLVPEDHARQCFGKITEFISTTISAPLFGI